MSSSYVFLLCVLCVYVVQKETRARRYESTKGESFKTNGFVLLRPHVPYVVQKETTARRYERTTVRKE
jgi:hypothetical protein